MQLLWRFSLFLTVISGVVYVICDANSDQETMTDYAKTVYSLVKCVIESNETLSNSGIAEMMQEGYGCHCYASYENPGSLPEDDIDRVCKAYHECMESIFTLTCSSWTSVEDIPYREYKHDVEEENCKFSDGAADRCAQYTDVCQRSACEQCDFWKAKDIEEQMYIAIKRYEETKDEENPPLTTNYEKIKSGIDVSTDRTCVSDP